MSAVARAGPLRPRARLGYAAPLLPPAWARLAAFAPLVTFCALMWARMLGPPRVGSMLAAAGLAVATGAAAIHLRGARLAAAGAASVAGSLLVAGVPVRLLWPGAWNDLLRGLSAGFGDLPATNVPYRGPDPWIAAVLLLIGVALAVLAAWLAFAPRRSGGRRGPVPSALALAVLFTVPAVQAPGDGRWVQGVVLAVLLCAFLHVERIERHGARAAGAVVLAAGLLAALAAPRLDAAGPILDYEALAGSLAPARGLTFAWDHTYGALRWPRTGREMLRIRARTPSYWKAEDLSRFDGVRWLQSGPPGLPEVESNVQDAREAWREEIHVRVRGMMSRLFVGAGTTFGISQSPRVPVRNAPGTFRTEARPLQAGHAYDADVYVPHPSRRQLRAAHGNLPGWAWEYLRIDLPPAEGGPVLPVIRSSAVRTPPIAQIAFPAYGTNAIPTVQPQVPGELAPDAARVMRRSDYGGVWRLAQRLLRGTSSPYDYVERVLRHLAHGYTYSETPRASSVPLVSFLLDDREGYCQQFSGAMALLLRMGGVPARVSTGFSPGTLDRDTGEYVVRDTDAHSWVEADIAPYGWVTFDPTPPVGPARLTPATSATASAYGFAASVGVLGSERVGDRHPLGEGPAGGSSPIGWIAAATAVVLAVAAGALTLRRRRRLRRGPPLADLAVAELQRALAGTGRAPQPGLTLQSMLRRYHGTPAEAYLRTLQAARYGGEDVAPTRAMRSAMRKELTLGLGPAARLGAWRAIPPVALRSTSTRPPGSYPDAR